MKQVFTSEDQVFLHHLKNVLEAKGIGCEVKNTRLSSLAGELPLNSCWPELWVIDELQSDWAKEIIESINQTPDDLDVWVCENCGEKHSARFTDCWNCQSTKAF